MQSLTIVLFLHALFAFAAIGFLVVPGTIMVMAARTRDVPFIRKVFTLGSFHGKIGGPLALLTGVVGFAVAAIAGIPLNSGWLIAAYVAYALVIALGIGYHMRWEMRVAALAQTSPIEAPSPELAAAIDDPLGKPMLWLSGFLWIVLIYLMVVKPF